jgi:hypothetical protein
LHDINLDDRCFAKCPDALYYCEVKVSCDFCDNIIIRYYTGFPKDLGPSRVIHFTSGRDFADLLNEGFPVVVAFTIR